MYYFKNDQKIKVIFYEVGGNITNKYGYFSKFMYFVLF